MPRMEKNEIKVTIDVLTLRCAELEKMRRRILHAYNAEVEENRRLRELLAAIETNGEIEPHIVAAHRMAAKMHRRAQKAEGALRRLTKAVEAVWRRRDFDSPLR